MDKCISDIDTIVARYERARYLEQESFTKTMALNASIYPKWIDESDTFVYERETRVGKEYRIVHAPIRSNELAFDHAALAASLSDITGEEISPEHLPINQVNVSLARHTVEFRAFDKHWCFHSSQNICEELPRIESHWLVSPNRKRAVFLRDYNLWLKDLDTNEEHALTTDGECHYAYAVTPERIDICAGLYSSNITQAPQALWSPDSKRLFTMQTDERRVLSLPVTAYVPSDGSARPQAWTPRYALPGDKDIAEYRMVILDVESALVTEANYPNVLDTGVMPGPFQHKRAWWSCNSDIAYFVDMSRYEKQARIISINAINGDSTVLFDESAETYIDLNFMNEEPCSLFPIPDSQELIWFSERSGWAHLYLYDLNTGALKRTLTEGKWVVREVVFFDAYHRDVYFQAAGRLACRDPYYREICRVNVDSGELTVVASSDHDYVIHRNKSRDIFCAGTLGRDTNGVCGVSPSGNYFVTTRTRVDEIPITELRDRNGDILLEVEVADISSLPDNWQWPEPVKLRSADGKTSIYGVVFRPSDFDESYSYPIIDFTLGLSIAALAPKGSFFSDMVSVAGYLPAMAWAELGFIVVVIDGRGTTYRDKAFHDESYGRMHKASNLEDHIEGIKQLADRYPYMDIDRVGITSPGGCNAPVYGLLAYPDFYKVGVACSVYDSRLMLGFETYLGPGQSNNGEDTVLCDMAANLKGKLLVIHGMMDNFFQAAGMFRLIEAFVRENKDVDMLVLPNGGHMFCSGYQLRRAWDYMVKHLQQNNTPSDFKVDAGVEFALKSLG